MSDMILLTCPACGGALKAIPGQDTLTCTYCGNSHIIRQQGSAYKLEAFARCPVCKRNDQTQKVVGVLREKPQLPLRPEYASQIDRMYYCHRDDIAYLPGEETSLPFSKLFSEPPRLPVIVPTGLFDVVLVSSGTKRWGVARAICRLTTFDLMKSYMLAGIPNITIVKGLSRQEAERAGSVLVEAGGSIHYREVV